MKVTESCSHPVSALDVDSDLGNELACLYTRNLLLNVSCFLSYYCVNRRLRLLPGRGKTKIITYYFIIWLLKIIYLFFWRFFSVALIVLLGKGLKYCTYVLVFAWMNLWFRPTILSYRYIYSENKCIILLFFPAFMQRPCLLFYVRNMLPSLRTRQRKEGWLCK